MSPRLICVCIILCNLFKVSVAIHDAAGCSAAPLLPNNPFVIVWNHPSTACENKGIHLDFERWGIVDNTKDRFFGEQIVLFYNLGKWPYYTQQGLPVNGGLPQLGDLQAHLGKIDDDLKTYVWNKTFSGLGVIDMESWRPLYWTNYDSKSIYQRKSLALAKQRFPHYNKTQILAEAIKEFNNAAKDFMGQTLNEVKAKRPNGKWGYYLFPQCFDKTCNTATIKNNDRISWLFQNSSGLYPSIYFSLSTPHSARALKIKHVLHEAFRVKAKYSPQNIPVMPYTLSQNGPEKMYQKEDLSYSILQPANMGSSGVVIWGSSSDLRFKNECLILKDYIDRILGPFSLNVTNFFGNCSEQLCNSHGRCVRKDYERVYQHHLRESGRSDCLIQNERLYNLKSDKDTYIKRKKNNKNELFNGRNKVKTFIDHIKEYLKPNLKGRNEYNIVGEGKKLAMKMSKSVINFSMKSDKEFTVKQSISTLFAPNYDFDDYVCKCFPGYTGDHCQNKL